MVVVVQASGGLSLAGNALVGLDNAIKGIVDIRAMLAPKPTPKFVPIKKVVVPANHPQPKKDPP